MNGIVSFGLGGNQNAMTIGQFSLRPFKVIVEVLPPMTGGSSGNYVQPLPLLPTHQTVQITIYYKNSVWKRAFKFKRSYAKVTVWAASVGSLISTGINITVNSIKKLLNNVRIRT